MKKPRHGKGRRKLKADRQLTPADWTPECREAFNLLKQALLEKVTLVHPDFSKPFLLSVDASSNGLGAVLSQVGPRNVVADALSREPFVRPSVFHRLTRVPYGAVLEEARALNTDCVQDVFHWSCHTFEMDGRSHCPGAGPSMDAGERGRPGAGPSTDTVVANCTAVIGSQDPHITPREVCAVLSRCQSQDEYVWPHAYLLPQLTQGLQPSPESEVHVLSRQELMEMQRADTVESSSLLNGSGDPLEESIHMRQWMRCVFSKSPEARAPLESIVTTRPLELVCIDFWSVEDLSNKSVDVFVVTNHFTKLAQAYPCSNQSAKVVAQQLWNNFFCTYGFPEHVHSDQGTIFESSLIAEMLQVAGIQKSHMTPYYPMGNWCVERFNQTLGNMIQALPPKAKHRC
ncbi:hypothetical protein AAFF_G00190000 [Aldrovandia affinis]|uniref:Integrase catalytic domain-containing protein n=1 Tax=Aldrovandia affinis TaxID=143900 RepID=A0AAD7W764_9TELE|nr:hypothetical protein AAFF_G00190000 [Aldrovandia affinis]